jgi:hypothetical protein
MARYPRPGAGGAGGVCGRHGLARALGPPVREGDGASVTLVVEMGEIMAGDEPAVTQASEDDLRLSRGLVNLLQVGGSARHHHQATMPAISGCTRYTMQLLLRVMT